MFSYKTEIFYINVEKISVFERQNNVALSTLNQFWVDSEKQFFSYIMFEKLKSLYQR